jgi:hypothetical protein
LPLPTIHLPTPSRRPLIEVLDRAPGSATADTTAVPLSFGHRLEKDTPIAAASEQSELVECVLGLLAGILGMGQQLRAPAEEALIREMLEPLQTIAFHSDESAEGKLEICKVLAILNCSIDRFCVRAWFRYSPGRRDGCSDSR